MITNIERMDLTIDNIKELDFIFADDFITPEEVNELRLKYGSEIKIFVKEVGDEIVNFIGVPGLIKTNSENGGIVYYHTQLYHVVYDPDEYKPPRVDLGLLFSEKSCSGSD